MLRLFFRSVSLLIMLSLLSCAGPGGSSNGAVAGTTTITINLSGLAAGTVAAGAVVSAVALPLNVQSVRVEALNNGVMVAAASAKLPAASVQLNVLNGVYIFRLIAFQGAVPLYQGLSTSQSLTGLTLSVPITLSGFVGVQPRPSTVVNPGDIVSFDALFKNLPPTTLSPLVWSAAAGAIAVDATVANGGKASWTAPVTPGTYTVIAKLDPNVFPDDNGSGHVVMTVKDVTPPTIIPSSSSLAVPASSGVASGFGASLAAVALSQTAIDPRSALLQAWLDGATAVDDADGTVFVTHSVLPTITRNGVSLGSGFPLGLTDVVFSATDASGNSASLRTTVNIYTPSPPMTFKTTDINGNPVANVSIGGVDTASQLGVKMLDTRANNVTDSTGTLISAVLVPNKQYLIVVYSTQDGYANGFWTGAVTGASVAYNQPPAIPSAGVTMLLRLSTGTLISGTVLDNNGKAVPFARVDFVPTVVSPYFLTVFADASGHFAAGLPVGSYQLLATGSVLDQNSGAEHAIASRLVGGFYAGNNLPVTRIASQASLINVVFGQSQTLSMRLQVGGMIVGRVYASNGQPVVGLKVNIEPYGMAGNKAVYQVLTDPSGLYQANVVAGNYRVLATNTQFDQATRLDVALVGAVGGYNSSYNGGVSRVAADALIHHASLGGVRTVDMTLQ